MATNQKSLPILKDILKSEVKLEDAQENVEILCKTLEILIEKMKTVNPLFKQLYNRTFYTGSYFDGLRVKSATEFDLNLVLVFPFKPADFEILTNCSPPSFAKFRLTAKMEQLSTRNGWQEIKNTLKFFEGEYLIPEKIRCWFQGIVDSATINSLSIPKVSKIQKSCSGPARTLYIRTVGGVQLDVDLVPVIEFKWPNWPKNAKQHFPNQNIPEKEKYWFIVPKPAPPELAGAKEKVNQLWRLHFPGIERYLLHNKGCAKPIIKLMKLLRDKQNWAVLASYYLKTVVMWSILNDNLNWSDANMDTLFVEMLKKLDDYVKNRMLPYLFYPSFNLLNKLKANPVLADNIHGSLSRIIRNIEKNPEEYNALMKK